MYFKYDPIIGLIYYFEPIKETKQKKSHVYDPFYNK